MPWNVDSANPADDAIVSQYPANERNSREQIEGWMDYEHDKTTGRHKIPAGTTSARDGITEHVNGGLWINTSFSPPRLQIRVGGEWQDVGAGFAGSASIEGDLAIVGSAATRLKVERTGAATNSTMEFATTDGSVFAGRANETYFAIGSSNNLNASGNRWLEVASDHTRVRGNLFATGNLSIAGTISGNASGATHLNASNLASGTVPNARLGGNYSFGGLTLSSTLSVGGTLTANGSIVSNGSIQVNSNNIYLSSSANRHLWFRDPDNTANGVLFLNTADGGLYLRVYNASGSSVHQLALQRNGRAEFTGHIYGDGRGLTNIPAGNLTGTIANARLSGTYTGININSTGTSQFGAVQTGRIIATSGNSFGQASNTSYVRIYGGEVGNNASANFYLRGANASNGPEAWFGNSGGMAIRFTTNLVELGHHTNIGGNLATTGNIRANGTIQAMGNQGAIYGDGSRITIAPATGDGSGRDVLIRPRGSGTSSNQTAFHNDGRVAVGRAIYTPWIHIGSGSGVTHIHRDTNNSSMTIAGGNASDQGANIILRGPSSSNGRGSIRNGTTEVIRWDATNVWIRGGSSQLYPASTVSTTGSHSTTDFPVGHQVFVRGGRSVRNSSDTVRLNTSNNNDYAIGGSGAILSGTWRHRGGAADSGTVIQRMA